MVGNSLPTNNPSVFISAMGQYFRGWDALPKTLTNALSLGKLLSDGGYGVVRPSDEGKNGASECLRKWFAVQAGPSILFWAGHGKVYDDDFYLIAKDSPLTELNDENAINARRLGEWAALSPSDNILIVIDACFAGAGISELINAFQDTVSENPTLHRTDRNITIIASTGPTAAAMDGVFSGAILNVLQSPDPTCTWWNLDMWIRVDDLIEAIKKKSTGQNVLVETLGGGFGMLPNPKYDPDLPNQSIEEHRRNRHFESAEIAISADATNVGFTGRRSLVLVLAKRLASKRGGMVIVTGPPGSGKSALLGKMISLAKQNESPPGYGRAKKILEQVFGPSGKVFDAEVNAKGKSLDDCLVEIWLQCGFKNLPEEFSADKLVGELKKVGSDGSKNKINILVDAIDEMQEGHVYRIVYNLLRPLMLLPNVFLLVGVRRSLEGKNPDNHKGLRKHFGRNPQIIDMAQSREGAEDLKVYVYAYLKAIRNRYTGWNAEKTASAAKRIIKQADGSFLYAKTACHHLERMNDPESALPKDVLTLFKLDLKRRAGFSKVDDLLRALAWGEGMGVSRRSWLAFANALASEGTVYKDSDLLQVLSEAGFYIIESGDKGQAVYRLIHKILADHYRKTTRGNAEKRIVKALLKTHVGLGWLGADPYLKRFMALHASRGGEFDSLLKDVGFLAVAEPSSLTPLLHLARQKQTRKIADAYRCVVQFFEGAKPSERMQLLELAGKRESLKLPSKMAPLLAGHWRCRWSDCLRASPHQEFQNENGEMASSVAFGLVSGTPVVFVGEDDGVRMWDARTSEVYGNYFDSGGTTIRALLSIEREGRTILLSEGKNFAIMQWDPRTGVECLPRLLGHKEYISSMVEGRIGEKQVVISASPDNTLRVWELDDCREIVELRQILEAYANAVAFGVTKEEKIPFAIAGCVDGDIHMFNLLNGKQMPNSPIKAHSGVAIQYLVSFETSDGTRIVSCDDKLPVRLWDAENGEMIFEMNYPAASSGVSRPSPKSLTPQAAGNMTR